MRRCALLFISIAALAQTSDQKERALGKSLAADFERQSRVLHDPIVTTYVQKLADDLAANSGAKLALNVKVVDSEEPAAAAFPGGFLFVSTGLIAAARSESEFVGRIAHQIAHIASAPVQRPAAQGQPAAVVFMSGDSGLCARFGQGGMKRVELEQQADLLGASYASRYRSGGEEFARIRQRVQSNRPARRPPSLRNPN
jgi:predicted Zn-dependent protease